MPANLGGPVPDLGFGLSLVQEWSVVWWKLVICKVLFGADQAVVVVAGSTSAAVV